MLFYIFVKFPKVHKLKLKIFLRTMIVAGLTAERRSRCYCLHKMPHCPHWLRSLASIIYYHDYLVAS